MDLTSPGSCCSTPRELARRFAYHRFGWVNNGLTTAIFQRGVRSFLLGTDSGTVVVFLSLAVAIIAAGAGLVTVTDIIQREEVVEPGSSDVSNGTNSTIPSTSMPPTPRFGVSLWYVYGLFVDPGAQTGLDAATTTNAELAIAICLSLVGFTWVLVAFGVIAERADVVLKALRRRNAKVVCANHTLVLGWTGKTLFLLRELAQMLTDGPNGGGVIVILGDLDALDMREEVDVTYRDFHRRWPRVQLHFWKGKPHEVDDLERVSIAAARHVLVLGASKDARVADSLVISSLCALAVLEAKVRASPSARPSAREPTPRSSQKMRVGRKRPVRFRAHLAPRPHSRPPDSRTETADRP